MTDADELRNELSSFIAERDAYPNRCPWCGYSGMLSKHMPAKHPKKWQGWKAEHEQIKINRDVWVEK